MKRMAQEFLDAVEKKGYKHGNVYEDDKMIVVPLTFTLDNAEFTIEVFFENDGTHVAIRCFDLLKVKDQQFAPAVLCCNDLNKAFRWVKFYVDREKGNVVLEDDAIVIEGAAGGEILELVLRMATIADESYPKLNKAIWA